MILINFINIFFVEKMFSSKKNLTMKTIISIFVSAFFFMNVESDFPTIIGELEPNGNSSEPLYIGISTSPIIINKNLQLNFEWVKNHHSSNENSKYQDTEKAKVEILVNRKVDLTKKGLEDSHKLILVLIKNIENDTIIVGYTCHIPIILEAKDENGEWNDITERFLSCGTGTYPILFYPNHIVLTCLKLPKQGDYYTTLRVKLGQNYSNEFGGIINKDWFENRRYGGWGNTWRL